MDQITRRMFMVQSASVTAGFLGLRSTLSAGVLSETIHALDGSTKGLGFGPLIKDPDGVLDLPKGFMYRVISPMGNMMDDGLIVPGKHDAMASFPYVNGDGTTDPGRCILIRNHEIEDAHRTLSAFGSNREHLHLIPPNKLYDAGHGRPSKGGCTTVVYNLKTQRSEKHWMSLAGTERNCAGGPTPWGSWISCEETASIKGERFEHDHGYCFEVPATTEPEIADPKPMLGLGRFMHEAVCIDPTSGIVYLTEDRHDGVLYRFVPDVKPAKAGDLLGPGKLQALKAIGNDSLDTRNWDAQRVAVGQSIPCGWITLDHIDSPKDDLRFRAFDAGAARFARGEGMWWGSQTPEDTYGSAYFACTTGGKVGAGQIWKLTPSGLGEGLDTLELLIEPNDTSVLQNADNITFSPWGDIVVCEDGEAPQYLVGITPKGELYHIAKNAYSGSEFAGACFSPDGSTFFVNLQQSGWTLAITGPWA
ncbi:MAG: alkaline phosphatase PhoX [Phycisphaerales bacterium]